MTPEEKQIATRIRAAMSREQNCSRISAVESRLSIVDLFTTEQLREFERSCNDIVSRLAKNLLAWRETPDPHDQEMDDLRMQCAGMEIEIQQSRALLEKWVAARYDDTGRHHREPAEVAAMDETRKFLEGK